MVIMFLPGHEHAMAWMNLPKQKDLSPGNIAIDFSVRALNHSIAKPY